ncbi:MAG: DUF4136 domain-containing protein [Deltaproteobacteria bacterium]|nr:DUF4136 domain-containing protein [Deltaproteobacteria bacterium]
MISCWKYLAAFLLSATVLLAGGCASVYRVQVNGYTDPAAPVAFHPGATFFVMDPQKSPNPLLDKEIKAKIHRLLESRGYVLVPFAQAEYYLFFTYGMDTTSGASAAPEYSVGVGFGFGDYCSDYSYFFWPGYVYYPRYMEPLYDRWLRLKVVEAGPYRETGQLRTLWVGESRSTGTSSDIREVINSLLVAAFSRFGQNTGKAVTVELRPQDPRLRQLEVVR